MFSSTIQPPLVSLFSSTGSHPLQLFSCGSETSLPSDSFLCFLNDASDRPAPPEPAALIAEPDTRQEHAILPTSDVDVTVLHIQSPTLRSTYIKSPPSGQLGLKLPWFHMQVKNLGREWSFEVGVVDNASREGIIRCSTFQDEPVLYPTTPPILHLPLQFPQGLVLTPWSTISINLPSLISHFSSSSILVDTKSSNASYPIAPTNFSHVSMVKVYATCRLRRIWFSEVKDQSAWEFGLFARTG